MKVLIINSFYYPNVLGGAEISVRHLAEGLLLKGHEVVIVCLGTEPSVSNINGVKVYRVSLFNLYFPFIKRPSLPARLLWNIFDIYNPVMARRVGKILDSEQPDIVHTNILLGFSCAVWRTIHKRNIRLVHTIRDHLLLCPRSTMYKNGRNCTKQCLSCRIFSFGKIYLGAYIDHVIGISQYILDRHLSVGWFKTTAQSVIFNSYRKNEKSERRVSEGKKLCFGYIGRITEGKGIELLLRTYLSLGENDTVELIIAGTGEDDYMEKMKTLAGNSNVKFLGFVPRAEFYGKVDIVIIPSLLHEALGRAVLEAYAYGVPVIGSRRGGIPEIIEEGKTGLLFDPQKDGDLRRALEQVTSDSWPGKDMSVACLLKSEEFKEEIIANKYLEVYENGTTPRSVPSQLNGFEDNA